MTCEPNQPTDPCTEPCPLEKIPSGLLAEKATNILNDLIDKLNCTMCPDIVGPTATPTDLGSGVPGTILNGDLSGFVTEGDDPTLTYELDTSDPKASNITLNPDGTFAVDTTGLAVETCSVQYTVTDGNGLSDTSTITWEVLPNTTDASDDDAGTVVVGNSTPINLLANDSDAEGDSQTVTMFDGQDPTTGPITTADGIIVTVGPDGMGTKEVPTGVAPGTYSYTYEVTDAQGTTATAECVIVVEAVPPPTGVIESTDADDAGQATITTTGTEDDGSAFDASDKGQLIIRTKTDGNIILDTGMVANGTTGDIEFPAGSGNVIGSYEIGGDTSFDTTAVLMELGLCCFEAEYTACNDMNIQAETVVTEFEGDTFIDLASIFGRTAGRPLNELSANVGFVSWVGSPTNKTPPSGALGAGFEYGLVRDFTGPPATVSVDFAVPVKDLLFEVRDLDEWTGVNNSLDTVILTANNQGAPAMLSGVSSGTIAGGAVVSGNGTATLTAAASGAAGQGGIANDNAVENVVSVTVADPVTQMNVELINGTTEGTSDNGHGVGLHLISARCCDPALGN